MVSLSLDGSSLSSRQVSEVLTEVKNEGTTTSESSSENDISFTAEQCTDELTLMDVELDADQIELFVDMIRYRMMQKNFPPWKGIHIQNCAGLVNDAILTCTTATNVRQLSVRQHNVNLQTIQCLTYGLKYNHQMQSLKLAIPLDSASSRALSTAVARSATLQELSLENCTNFDEPGVIMNLSFGLRLNQHLKSLSLDSCYLKDDQVSSILMALDGHASLKKLSLQRNACHTQGMAAVATLLHGDLLEELDLSFLVRKTKEELQKEKENKETVEANQLEEQEEEETKDEKTVAIEEDDGIKPAATETNGSKQENDNQPNTEDDHGEEQSDEVDEQMEVQVRNTNLRVLLLAGNGLGDAYLESVLNIFGKDSKLETLSLFGNRLSSQAICRLILKQKLPHLKQLKRLYLGHNAFFEPLNIKDDLIHAIKRNFSLEEVMIKSLLNPDVESSALQTLIDHYCRLNIYGRRIIGCFDTKEGVAKKLVPLGLWADVLAHANQMQEKQRAEGRSNDDTPGFAADAIYCLLHSPVLYENPNLGPASTMVGEGFIQAANKF
jgi:hypothetical protein